MHVFVTGATGWVGSAIVKDLIEAGHTVSGLSRSADKAIALTASGARPVTGSLEDFAVLQQAAMEADAVIHTAFNHDFIQGNLGNDFSKFLESAALDERVIEFLGKVLSGSDRPLLVTSGLSGLPLGAIETDLPNPAAPRKSELAAQARCRARRSGSNRAACSLRSRTRRLRLHPGPRPPGPSNRCLGLSRQRLELLVGGAPR